MSDRPDELRHQLATLWRTARVGIDTVKEIAVRSSEEGRLRLDIALLRRERWHRQQEIGARICELMDARDPSTQALPESVRALCRSVQELDERIRSQSARVQDNAYGAPRGYEPEAAVDYGDEPDVEEAASDDRHL